jgi:hypothetical protein
MAELYSTLLEWKILKWYENEDLDGLVIISRLAFKEKTPGAGHLMSFEVQLYSDFYGRASGRESIAPVQDKNSGE